MPASAATFLFSSGTYVPGVTSPNPLLTPDILQLTTGAGKTFGAGSFTNQSGKVEWQGGNVSLLNGAAIDNRSLFDVQAGVAMSHSGGGSSSFTNSGIFRTSGAGSANINSGVAFINSGQIDAQSGTIGFGALFMNSGAVFNAGTSFTGAGSVRVFGGSWNGAFTSENLVLETNRHSATGAVMNGLVGWRGGDLLGSWQVANGATLAISGFEQKRIGAGSFVNLGQMIWNDASTLETLDGALLLNAGTIDIRGDGVAWHSGGGSSVFVNSGLIEKTAGTGVTTLGAFSQAFNNLGQIDAQSGTIQFTGSGTVFAEGSSFTGAGIVAQAGNAEFVGAFTSENLVLASGVHTGNNAVANGMVDWHGGTMAGAWEVASGAALAMSTGSGKTFGAGSFVNNGNITWSGGNVALMNGAAIDNRSLFDIQGNVLMSHSGGGSSSFTNSGIFRTSGAGSVNINSGVGFINSGQIDAQSGTIGFGALFMTSGAVFNAGTSFTGAGTVRVNGGTWNGAFTSENLLLADGAHTGNGAVMNGMVNWEGGRLAGSWQVANGATLAISTFGQKRIGGTFINNGQMIWIGNGPVETTDGALIINAGSIDIRGDGVAFDSGGGGSSVFVNAGLIEKTAGVGITTLAGGALAFANSGTINVYSGTIALPSDFTNAGTLGGTATFATSSLTNAGIIAPGAPGETGTLSLSGNFVQSADGLIAVDLASIASFDLFQISGSAALDGLLLLSCIQGCDIATGDSFVFLTSGGPLSGAFSGVNLNGFLRGFAYDLVYGADFVRLDVLDAGIVPEPGTWALMIVGYGLIGVSIRRSRRQGVRRGGAGATAA